MISQARIGSIVHSYLSREDGSDGMLERTPVHHSVEGSVNLIERFSDFRDAAVANGEDSGQEIRSFGQIHCCYSLG
jgi:hypothetical protein